MNKNRLRQTIILLISCSIILDGGCAKTIHEESIKNDNKKTKFNFEKQLIEYLKSEINENSTEIKIRNDIILNEKNEKVSEKLIENNSEIVIKVEETKEQKLFNYINYQRNANIYSKEQIQIAESLINALLNNPYLIDDEKYLFLSNPQIFYDNALNFDYEGVYNNLSTLFISYQPIYKGCICAEFYIYSNASEIKIYTADSFYNTNPYLLTHEFCHALQSPHNHYEYYGFRELINVCFNNDYFANEYGFDEDYIIMQKYYYVFLSLLDKDILYRFQMNVDISEIQYYMMDIIPDYDPFIILMRKLNCLADSIYEIDEETMYELDSEITDILNQYYYAKYGRYISEDVNIRSRF